MSITFNTSPNEIHHNHVTNTGCLLNEKIRNIASAALRATTYASLGLFCVGVAATTLSLPCILFNASSAITLSLVGAVSTIAGVILFVGSSSSNLTNGAREEERIKKIASAIFSATYLASHVPMYAGLVVEVLSIPYMLINPSSAAITAIVGLVSTLVGTFSYGTSFALTDVLTSH